MQDRTRVSGEMTVPSGHSWEYSIPNTIESDNRSSRSLSKGATSRRDDLPNGDLPLAEAVMCRDTSANVQFRDILGYGSDN